MFFLLQHKQSSIFLSCFSKVQPANQVQVYYTVDQYIHTNPEHSAVDHLQEMDGAICLPRPHREEILPKLLFFFLQESFRSFSTERFVSYNVVERKINNGCMWRPSLYIYQGYILLKFVEIVGQKKKVLPVSVAEQERILKPNTDVRVIHCFQM